MDVQIKNICKTAFYHLRNIAKIRKFLTHRQCEILIHAFISSKLDYCNVVLSGLQQSQINRLQHVQNSAARLLTATSRYDHVTPVLRCLHWLPVSARIDFKILLLVFKVLNAQTSKPLYVLGIVSNHSATRNIHRNWGSCLPFLWRLVSPASSVAVPLPMTSVPNPVWALPSVSLLLSPLHYRALCKLGLGTQAATGDPSLHTLLPL